MVKVLLATVSYHVATTAIGERLYGRLSGELNVGQAIKVFDEICQAYWIDYTLVLPPLALLP